MIPTSAHTLTALIGLSVYGYCRESGFLGSVADLKREPGSGLVYKRRCSVELAVQVPFIIELALTC